MSEQLGTHDIFRKDNLAWKIFFRTNIAVRQLTTIPEDSVVAKRRIDKESVPNVPKAQMKSTKTGWGAKLLEFIPADNCVRFDL